MEEELIEEVKEEEIEESKEIKVMDNLIEDIRGKLDKRDALILKQKEGDIKHADEQVRESKEKWDKGMADFPEEFETYGDFKRADDVMEKYSLLLKQIRDELEFLLIILNEQIDKEKKAYILLSKSSLEIEKILGKSKEKIEEILEKSKEKNKEKQEKINRLKEEINKLKKTKKIYKENQKLKKKNKEYRIKIRELNAELKNYGIKKKIEMKKQEQRISPQMREAHRRYKDGETQVDIAKDMGKDKGTINTWITLVDIDDEKRKEQEEITGETKGNGDEEVEN